MSAPHTSVLLDEVIAALEPASGKLIVDGTFGAGGYSRAFLATGADVVAFDRDPSARKFAEGLGERFRLVDGRFSQMADELGEGVADGVALDLGVSSMQLDRRTHRVAERHLVHQRDVAVEQGAAAALDAVGLDRGKADNAVEGTGDERAEFLRHDDAPLGVHLFLEGREKHLAAPQIAAPSEPPTSPRFGPAEPPAPTRRRSLTDADWVNMGSIGRQ